MALSSRMLLFNLIIFFASLSVISYFFSIQYFRRRISTKPWTNSPCETRDLLEKKIDISEALNKRKVSLSNLGLIKCGKKDYVIPNEEELLKILKEEYNFPLNIIPRANKEEIWNNFEQDNVEKTYGMNVTRLKDEDSDHHLAVIIPCSSFSSKLINSEVKERVQRGKESQRCNHLRIVVSYMYFFLEKVNHNVFIVSQNYFDKKLFNKGAIINIAIKYVPSKTDYLVFQDVDMIPLNKTNAFRFHYIPISRTRNILNYNPLLGRKKNEVVRVDTGFIPYRNFGGAVVQVPLKYFIEMGGWSNSYWGSGGVDDDYSNRVLWKLMFSNLLEDYKKLESLLEELMDESQEFDEREEMEKVDGFTPREIIPFKKRSFRMMERVSYNDGFVFHLSHNRGKGNPSHDKNRYYLEGNFLDRPLFDGIQQFEKDSQFYLDYEIVEVIKSLAYTSIDIKLNFEVNQTRLLVSEKRNEYLENNPYPFYDYLELYKRIKNSIV